MDEFLKGQYMAISHFPEHGRLKLSTVGQILIIEGEGPANIEAIKDYQTRVVQYREAIMQAPWASLVLLSGVPLITADGIDLLHQIVTDAKALKLKATAIVFIDVEFENVIRQFWESIYKDVGVTYGFFDTEQDAKEWLLKILGSR